MNPTEILQKYWGHEQFRPLQEEIIESVLQKKDTLALLPTGGGKSICFQVPVMMQDGICLVISPLIALMKDQVEALKNKGIGALSVHSGMSFAEVRQTLQNASFGNFKFLYVSPERLETKLFLEYLPALKPVLIAVDEAHCISQWGYDFRPSYMRIAALREELPGVPVIALTASATPAVQDDICTNLLFGSDSRRFQQSFIRPNLSYSVFQPVSKEKKLAEILKNVPGSAIIYCKSRKQTMKLSELLKLQNISADFYHAGLPGDQRTAKQDAWINNKTRVIVCTNAFGMGIDKSNVRAVVHYEAPDCLENYYQEAGRAGRDGKRSYAVLLLNKNEAEDLFLKIDVRYPSPEKIKQVYTGLMNFLQVAAGTGEDLSFSFDIAEFAGCFKLNITEAVYGIQALAQEGLLSYNETMFRQSTAGFCVNKNDLEEFELLQPGLEPIIKGLLRSYEGIFDFSCTIYESLLAKFIKIPVTELISGLQKLNSYGIIKYRTGSEKPEILLLRNRMYNDDYKIDPRASALRKEEAIKRTQGMVSFAVNRTLCRSRMIADYFGDKNSAECGICDNCINNKDAQLPAAEFKKVSDEILRLLKNEKLSIPAVLDQLKPVRQRSVWQVISFLLSEELIFTDKDNILMIKS